MVVLEIDSPGNDRVKALGRLRSKRERSARGLFSIEGWREIIHAQQAGLELVEVYFNQEVLSAEEISERLDTDEDLQVYALSQRAFEKVAYRPDTEGIIAVARMPKLSQLDALQLTDKPFILVLEGVQKPGNLGAIFRSAEGAGVDAIVITDPDCDLWNPNVIRASLGTIFLHTLIQSESGQIRQWCSEHGITTIAASPEAKQVYSDTDLAQPVAIVVGSEADGLSAEWRKLADELVNIPMRGEHDSLNVSVSTAILLYEVVRQRSEQV